MENNLPDESKYSASPRIQIPEIPSDVTLTPIHDKSFIVVLKRLEEQAKAAVKRSEPCVDDQHQDGIKLGELYMIQKVMKAFIAHV